MTWGTSLPALARARRVAASLVRPSSRSTLRGNRLGGGDALRMRDVRVTACFPCRLRRTFRLMSHVLRRGESSGVWFFSLDAARAGGDGSARRRRPSLLHARMAARREVTPSSMRAAARTWRRRTLSSTRVSPGRRGVLQQPDTFEHWTPSATRSFRRLRGGGSSVRLEHAPGPATGRDGDPYEYQATASHRAA